MKNEVKEVVLTVTEQELQVIAAGLDELPHKFAAPVVRKLQYQVAGQMRPADDVESVAAKAKAEQPNETVSV